MVDNRNSGIRGARSANSSRPGPGSDLASLRAVLSVVPWRMRPRLIGLLAASLASALLDLAAVTMMLPLTQMLTNAGEVPGVIRTIVVPVMGTEDRRALLIAVTLTVGIAFVTKNIALIAIRWWSLGIVNRAEAAAQSALLKKYLSSDYASFRTRSRSSILQAVTDAIHISFNSVLLGLVMAATDVVSIAVIFLALVVLAPGASLMALLVFGGAAILVSRVLKPYAYHYGLQGLNLNKDAWSQLNPAIEGFRETRIFRRGALFLERYRTNREEYAKVAQRQGILGEMPKYILEIAMIVGILAIALLLFATNDESTALGLLAVFAAAAIRIVPSLNRLVATVNGVRTGQANLRFTAREIESLSAEGGIDPIDSSAEIRPVPNSPIEFNKVSYCYPGAATNVLSEVDVTISRGTTIALVGASGAGKTTFADLLTGLLRPDQGTITSGGVDVAREPARWMAEVAVVSQRVYLWDASIRDLITFGQAEAEVDAGLLREVVRRAQLEEFISEQPDGLEQRVGDGGARISGGQAQRIGIARALYARPRLLILDEATSALDNETEHQITEMISSLRGELTVVVIAHRLSTVKNADEILYFANGKLAGRGAMYELTRSNPDFARLVKLGSLDTEH